MPKRVKKPRKKKWAATHVVAVFYAFITITSLQITASVFLEHQADAATIFTVGLESLFPEASATLTAEQRKAQRTRVSADRHALLQRTVSVQFVADGASTKLWTVALKDHASWLAIRNTPSAVTMEFDRDAIRHDLDISPPPLKQPQQCSVLSITPADETSVGRVNTDCTPRGGEIVDREKLISLLIDAFMQGKSAVTMPMRVIEPVFANKTAENLGTLELLAVGKSNFQGSGASRKSNVRKALKDRINNVLVMPEEEFSFNKMIGALHSADGWQMALGIFNGSDLKPMLGGGICQTSTTMYRAVLAAGLPIPVHKNHSIYVSYYERYGVGQDATVYLGAQDFTFVNDTHHPIIMQAYTQGEDAFVELYGTKDARTVTIDGPFFAKNSPPDMLINGKPVRKNQIVWKRDIHYTDGRTAGELFVSQYKALPSKLADKWIAMKQQNTQAVDMHAAAQ